MVARVVVLGALGLAHFVVDRTHPADAPAWRPGPRRACSAGTPAGTRRSPASGYGPLGTPVAALLPGRARCSPTGWPGSPAWATAPPSSSGQRGGLRGHRLLFVLVRRETGDAAVARRSIWVLSLLPAAFVLVMGYAESVLLVLRARLLPGPAPAGPSADGPAPLRPRRRLGLRRPR